MFMETLSGPVRKARAVNVVSASFPSRVPTVTEPAFGDSTVTTNTVVQAIDLGGKDGGACPSWMLIVPYGLGSNGNAFSMRVIGYRRIGSLWLPIPLAGWTLCTLDSSIPGIAGAPLINTEFFCNTMTLDTAFTNNAGISNETSVPGSGLIAHGMVALKGAQRVELTFAATSGSPTMNALVAAG